MGFFALLLGAILGVFWMVSDHESQPVLRILFMPCIYELRLYTDNWRLCVELSDLRNLRLYSLFRG